MSVIVHEPLPKKRLPSKQCSTCGWLRRDRENESKWFCARYIMNIRNNETNDLHGCLGWATSEEVEQFIAARKEKGYDYE